MLTFSPMPKSSPDSQPINLFVDIPVKPIVERLFMMNKFFERFSHVLIKYAAKVVAARASSTMNKSQSIPCRQSKSHKYSEYRKHQSDCVNYLYIQSDALLVTPPHSQPSNHQPNLFELTYINCRLISFHSL
jgi:hypothetical protein